MMFGQNNTAYDSETGSYRVECREGEEISTVLVAAIAQISDVDPAEMRPLGYDVDLERVEDLFRALNDDDFSGYVAFTVAGCEVEIGGADHVVITPQS